MPRYEITAPDGRRFEITAPQGASQADIMSYAQQNYGQPAPAAVGQPGPTAVPSGQPGFFGRIGEAFTGSQRMTPRMKGMQEIGSAPELNEMSVPAFKASIGLLMTGKTEELKGILTKQYGEKVSFSADEKGNTVVNFPSGEYALNKPGLSGQDVVRGVFDMLAFTPAGRATTIPRAIARSAGTEAAIEGVEAGVGGEFSPEDVALAGGIGGVGKGVEKTIGAGYRAIRGRPYSDVLRAGQQAQIPILTSDIRQPKTWAGRFVQQTGEKIPVFGTAGMREAQQTARVKATEDVTQQYGQYSYKAIVDSLKTQKDKIKRAAGARMEAVGIKLDSIGGMRILNTTDTIERVSEEVSKEGVLKAEFAVRHLKKLDDAINEAPQTFTSLKENRTAFREILEAADKAKRTQLTSKAKALLQEVDSAMRKDMDSFANLNLSPNEYFKWRKANDIYGKEAVKMTKTRIKNVLDKGDLTPEAVQNMLFSQKPSEVRNLYVSLTQEGKVNARSAIISKVIGNLSRRQSGFTPSSFATEMKKYVLQTGEFFKGEDKRQLNGLLNALDATRRAQEAGVVTATGQQMIGMSTLAALFVDPVKTIGAASTVGTLAKLYESKPVRNSLLRLASLPAGSTRFEGALNQLFAVLTAGAQSARESAQE